MTKEIDVLDNIRKSIEYYNLHYQKLQIEKLLDFQDKLSTNSFFLAEITGENKYQ